MTVAHEQRSDALRRAVAGFATELEDRIRQTGHDGPAVECARNAQATKKADPATEYALRLVAWGHAWIDGGGWAAAERSWYRLKDELEAYGLRVPWEWDKPREYLYGAQLRDREEKRRRAERLPKGPPMEPDEYEQPARESPWE